MYFTAKSYIGRGAQKDGILAILNVFNASTSLLVLLFFSLFSSSSPLLMGKIVGALDPALDENYTLGHVASIKNVQTTSTTSRLRIMSDGFDNSRRFLLNRQEYVLVLGEVDIIPLGSL